MTQSQRVYKRAPIIEAVVAIAFKSDLKLKDIERFSIKVKSNYPEHQRLKKLQLLENPQALATEKLLGEQPVFKLYSENKSQIILLEQDSMNFCRLAPYSDWETMMEETKNLFDTFEKICGRLAIKRISTRFINRIDVPCPVGGSIELDSYFNYGMRTPEGFEAYQVNSFSSVTRYGIDKGLDVIIQLAPMEAALIDHLSIQLDIDVLQTDIPQKRSDVWERMSDLRRHKNHIFEACITDKTRDLIS